MEPQIRPSKRLVNDPRNQIDVSELATVFPGAVDVDQATIQRGIDEVWDDGRVGTVGALSRSSHVKEAQSHVSHSVGGGVCQDECIGGELTRSVGGDRSGT